MERMKIYFRGIPVALSALFLFNGCSLAPHYRTPLVETASSYKEAGDWKVAQPRDTAIKGKWWELLEDPELNKLEEEVNISNQNIALASANFRLARAVVREAWSQFLPSLSVSPSVTYSRPSASVSSGSSGTRPESVRTSTVYSLPFDASYEVDLWGRVRNTVSADVSEAQATAADLQNTRLTVCAEVAVDYFQIHALDTQIEILTETVVAFQKSLDLTETRRRTGIASDEDVAQAQTQLETAKAQKTDLGIQRAQFEHAIAVLTGKSPSSFSVPSVTMNEKVPSIPASVPSELLERRPDVAAAERRVAEANARIGAARAAFFPVVSLGGTAGFSSNSTGNWFTWPSRFWSLGPTVAQTLFDAGKSFAVAEQAQASYDAAVADYRQTVLTAFQQVEDNLAAARMLSQETEEQQNAVKASERFLELANHRYQLGIDNYLNVITAQSALLTNQRNAVNIRMQRVIASIQLIKSLGGGWDAARDKAVSG